MALGCLNPDKRAQCLREKSVHEILNVPSPPDRPSVDSSRTSPYLLHNPLDLSTSREYLTDIDVMLGFTEDDGMLITQFLLAYPTLYNVLRSLWSFLGPYLLRLVTHQKRMLQWPQRFSSSTLIMGKLQIWVQITFKISQICSQIPTLHLPIICSSNTTSSILLQLPTSTDSHIRYVGFQISCKDIILRRCRNQKFSSK